MKSKKFRKIAIWFLKHFNPGTIKIKHPLAGYSFFLDCYMHKGYWFKGKNVEKDTMALFKELISPGNTIIEIGGHIGFISQYFSFLTEESGRVYVFEPASNNLRYLKKNIDSARFGNIVLIEKAVSDSNGVATFYMENVTGQNNSLLSDHVGPNSHANLKNEKEKFIQQVDTITLDSYISDTNIEDVGFIKIDIEGAEILALKGMMNCLKTFKPKIMLEVSRDKEEILKILKSIGYLLFNTDRFIVHNLTYGNFFAIHETDSKINQLNLIPEAR